MKITSAMMIISMGIVLSGMGVHAEEISNTDKAEAVVAGSAIVAISAEEGYEASAAARMAGRAGASSTTGAKGIAFETVYSDTQNIKDFVKGTDNVTKQTVSSTAKQVDLVKVNESGKVISRIQCKDTPNSIPKTIDQVKSGKYTQAQLVGTTETAEAFNAEAKAAGVTKTMKDSGISTKTTERIAEKALSSNPETVAKGVAKGASYAGVIDGGIAVYESVRDGDSIPDAIGHVATQTSVGTISGGAALGTASVAAAGLAAASAGPAATVLVPTAVAVGVGVGVHKGAEYLVEKYDVEETVSDTWETIGNESAQLVGGAIQSVDNTKVGTKVIDGAMVVSDTANKGFGYVTNGWAYTYNYITK